MTFLNPPFAPPFSKGERGDFLRIPYSKPGLRGMWRLFSKEIKCYPERDIPEMEKPYFNAEFGL
jgi:hypothetical protein